MVSKVQYTGSVPASEGHEVAHVALEIDTTLSELSYWLPARGREVRVHCPEWPEEIEGGLVNYCICTGGLVIEGVGVPVRVTVEAWFPCVGHHHIKEVPPIRGAEEVTHTLVSVGEGVNTLMSIVPGEGFNTQTTYTNQKGELVMMNSFFPEHCSRLSNSVNTG